MIAKRTCKKVTDLFLIQEATQRGQLTGNRKFEQEISKKIGRRIELRGQGKPNKEK